MTEINMDELAEIYYSHRDPAFMDEDDNECYYDDNEEEEYEDDDE